MLFRSGFRLSTGPDSGPFKKQGEDTFREPPSGVLKKDAPFGRVSERFQATKHRKPQRFIKVEWLEHAGDYYRIPPMGCSNRPGHQTRSTPSNPARELVDSVWIHISGVVTHAS